MALLTGQAQMDDLARQVQAGTISATEYQDVANAYATAGADRATRHFSWVGPGNVTSLNSQGGAYYDGTTAPPSGVGLVGSAQLQELLGEEGSGKISSKEYQDVYNAYQQAGSGGANEHFSWIGPGNVQVAAAGGSPSGDPKKQDPNQLASQNDAIALLSQELTSWGFGQDAISWATNAIRSNEGVDQVLYSLRQQPFYLNSIFGQTNSARTHNGLPVMTEAQILAYEDTAHSLAQQAGLPPGFMSTPELATLMGSDVSSAELDARITQGYTAASQAPQSVKDQLAAFYGVDTGHLAAYYLDPARALPLLQKQFQASQIGSQAQTTGYGSIDRAAAEGLAAQGVTDANARTGFSHLAHESPLFTPLPGSSEQFIGQGVQLGAEFGGNGADQTAITQRAQQRVSAFAGSYKYDQGNRGITGLGPVTPP